MNVLALDVETDRDGELCRIGLAQGKLVGTFDWSPTSMALTQRLVDEAAVVLAHNALFDVEKLLEAGVVVDKAKVWDTLAVHSLLYPHQLKALGHCAGLYVMTGPWKHMDSLDPEAYNAKDTAILLPIYEAQHDLLAQWGAVDLWWDIVGPAMWARATLARRGYWVREFSTSLTHLVQHGYRAAGQGGLYTAATGEVQACEPSLPAPWGTTKGVYFYNSPEGASVWHVRYSDPELELVPALIGCPSLAYKEAIDAATGKGATVGAAWLGLREWLRGAGPVQLNRRSPLEPKQGRVLRQQFDKDNPEWVVWKDRLEARVAKEHFIQNPFGRRLYTRNRSEAHDFLVRSTLADMLNWLVPHVARLAIHAVQVPDGFLVWAPNPQAVSTLMATRCWTELAPGLTLSVDSIPLTES